MIQELESLRPIIGDKNFTIDEKMEMLEAAFEREFKSRIDEKKSKAIERINSCELFDKTDARIIINSL